MNILEKFLETPAGKAIPPDGRPAVERLFEMFTSLTNAAVDDCLDLVRKWGEVKQLTNTEDFRLLLEYIEKVKVDSKD